MGQKKDIPSGQNVELVDKDGTIEHLKKGFGKAASGAAVLYDKATDTVRTMLDRILASSNQADTEAMKIFREAIKAMEEDIAKELAKDSPNYEFVIMMQDKKKEALESVQMTHDKIAKRDIELFRAGTTTVMVISGLVLKGLEMWLKERKS